MQAAASTLLNAAGDLGNVSYSASLSCAGKALYWSQTFIWASVTASCHVINFKDNEEEFNFLNNFKKGQKQRYI